MEMLVVDAALAGASGPVLPALPDSTRVILDRTLAAARNVEVLTALADARSFAFALLRARHRQHDGDEQQDNTRHSHSHQPLDVSFLSKPAQQCWPTFYII